MHRRWAAEGKGKREKKSEEPTHLQLRLLICMALLPLTQRRVEEHRDGVRNGEEEVHQSEHEGRKERADAQAVVRADGLWDCLARMLRQGKGRVRYLIVIARHEPKDDWMIRCG